MIILQTENFRFICLNNHFSLYPDLFTDNNLFGNHLVVPFRLIHYCNINELSLIKQVMNLLPITIKIMSYLMIMLSLLLTIFMHVHLVMLLVQIIIYNEREC
jgi:hypothetical protein